MLATGNNSLLGKGMSIRVSADGFSVSTLAGWQHFAPREGEPLAVTLGRTIRKVMPSPQSCPSPLLLFDYPSTRVPLDEFRVALAQPLYHLVYGTDSLQGLQICHQVLPGLDAVELYPICPAMRDVVAQRYPALTVGGYYGHLILQCHAHHTRSVGEGQTCRRMYVSVEGSQMMVCAFQGQALHYANTFADRLTADRLYMVMCAWSQLDMDQEQDTLVVLGRDPELETQLRRYVRHVI